MQLVIKRVFDLVFAGAVLIVFSPIYFAIAILIRITMGPPVIFRQNRNGYKESIFTLYKFRTMNNGIDKEGNLLSDDQRLTRVGYYIRTLSLDELPQFYNVLKGDMSVVGPRPLLPEYLPLYNEEQRGRYKVKSGIIGLAAVKGRNLNSWEVRFKLDLYYVNNWSLYLDLRIILLAFWTILSRRGVFEERGGTSSKFIGIK
ncbi:MAG: sugar transferase [Mariniphaga sp.]|nr:sugar transferase [Mariniphaga sp.]